MINFETGEELTGRLVGDYRFAADLAGRQSELQTSMQALQKPILDSIPIMQTTSPELFVAGEPADPRITEKYSDFFNMLAVKQEIDRRLAVLIGSLSQAVVGQTVVVKPLDTSDNIIDETYFSGALIGGSWRQELSYHKPKKAVGTIERVFPVDNVMSIKPARGTRASANDGYYHVPVLGNQGSPLISIDLREPGFRDKPSRTGKIVRGIFKPVLARS